jgi:hypothetical protein
VLITPGVLGLALALEFTTPTKPGDDPAPDEAAELDPDELFVTEVAMGSSIGLGLLNAKPLSDAWSARGYPGLPNLTWTPFAVNGELWVGRHVPAFDFIRATGAESDDPVGGTRTQLRTELIELSYGYAAFHRHGFSIVPRVGFGLYSVENRISSDGDLEFGDLRPEAPVDNSAAWVLAKGTMAADLGVGFGYLIAFGPREKLGLATGLRIGLRLGGLVQLFDFGPQGRAWKSEGNTVDAAPNMRMDTLYLRLFVAPSLLHRSRSSKG